MMPYKKANVPSLKLRLPDKGLIKSGCATERGTCVGRELEKFSSSSSWIKSTSQQLSLEGVVCRSLCRSVRRSAVPICCYRRAADAPKSLEKCQVWAAGVPSGLIRSAAAAGQSERRGGERAKRLLGADCRADRDG